MKTNRIAKLVALASCLAAFSTAGCSEKDKTAGTQMPSGKDMAETAETTSKTDPLTAAQMAAMPGSDVASAKWADIKDCTYDTRAMFFGGLKRLEARVDGQVSELTAKRAAMKSDANTKEWDFAMKEMEDSRTYLKSVGEELEKASAETWNQQKDTVGQAWERTQDAYSKVKASTTN